MSIEKEIVSGGIDYDALAKKVAQEMSVLSSPQALWDASDCACYLRISKTYFVNSVSKHPGFPKSTALPHEGQIKPHKKWLSSDIKEWAGVKNVG